MTSLGRKGVSLLELILVLVIVAIGCGLAYPRVQIGVENREVKNALETMRSISNSMRLYELDHDGLLPSNLTLTDLETAGYVHSNEFAPKFAYSIDASVAVPSVQAVHNISGRTLRLQLNPNVNGQDGTVTDSAFSPPPPPPPVEPPPTCDPAC